MGRHRRNGDEDSTPTEAISVVEAALPTVPEPRRGGRTVSPLLLGGGGVAIVLVLVIGGWAVAGGRSGGNPLVYPWNSQSPGPIDVSVSMEPTDLPSPSLTPSPSVKASPSPRVTVRPSRSASRSPESALSSSRAMTAALAGFTRWQGGYVVNFVVTNRTSKAAKWTVVIEFADDLQIDPPWNATVDDGTGSKMTFAAQQELPAGQSVSFGFRASHEDTVEPYPEVCTIDGRTFACTPRT